MREYNKVDALVSVRDKLVAQVKEQIKQTGNPYEDLEVKSDKDMDLKLNKLNLKR